MGLDKIDNSEDNKSHDVTRRNFLKGIGAAAAGVAASGILNNDAQAQSFGLSLDRLPAGSIRVSREQLEGLGLNTPLVMTVLMTLSQNGLIPGQRFPNAEVANVADDWQAGKRIDKQLLYLEYKTDPGEYRRINTRLDVSKLIALYVNMNAVDEFTTEYQNHQNR